MLYLALNWEKVRVEFLLSEIGAGGEDESGGSGHSSALAQRATIMTPRMLKRRLGRIAVLEVDSVDSTNFIIAILIPSIIHSHIKFGILPQVTYFSPFELYIRYNSFT